MNIATRILNGEADAEFDAVRAAIAQRQKMLASVKMTTFKVGDTVTFNQQTNPKYLRGQQAIISKVNQTTVTVDLVQPMGRFSRGIRVPASLLS